MGSRFAACMWICIKAVSGNGQENTQEYLMQRFRSIMEGVNCVRDDALEGLNSPPPLRRETEVLVALEYDMGRAVVFRHQQTLIEDFQTAPKKSRNTTKL